LEAAASTHRIICCEKEEDSSHDNRERASHALRSGPAAESQRMRRARNREREGNTICEEYEIRKETKRSQIKDVPGLIMTKELHPQ